MKTSKEISIESSSYNISLLLKSVIGREGLILQLTLLQLYARGHTLYE